MAWNFCLNRWYSPQIKRGPEKVKVSKPMNSMLCFAFMLSCCERSQPLICPKMGWRLGGVGTFGVVACVQEVAVTPDELPADADLIHYTLGASPKDDEEAVRKAVDFSTTARRRLWFDLPCEARFWERKLGPAMAHYP
jgi:hypothetical protein